MMHRRYSPEEMLAVLVGFDTTSRGSNLQLIDWVEEYLGAYGVPCRRSYDETGAKANLLATLGPPVEGGIVLSGHIELTVGGQSRVLGPGDAYYFTSAVPHRFRNAGEEPCELVSACTPPTF